MLTRFTPSNMRTSIVCWLLTLLAIGAGGAFTTLSAQSPPAPSRTAVAIGESFTVAMTPPPAVHQPRGLRLYVDGVKVGQDIAIPSSGDASVVVPGITVPGAHVLTASAFNDAAETSPVDRAVVNFWVGPPPAPGLRILVTTTTAQEFEAVPLGAGGLELRLVRSDTSTVIK